MPLSVSPSLLDSYRFWRSVEYADLEKEAARLEELRAQIRGESFQPSDAMLLGRAWHKALEGEPTPGYDFDPDALRTVSAELPDDAMLEARGLLELPEAGAVMRLRTDGLHGLTIHEHKTTSRINVDRYQDNAQWRAYCLAFEVQRVIYHVVKLRQDRQTGVYGLTEYLPLTLYAYPGMRADLVAAVADFRDFLDSENLLDYRQIEETEYAEYA